MRSIIWLVLLCVVAVVAATTLGSNDGLVTIYWAGWRTELSLNLFLILLLGGCALLFSAAQALQAMRMGATFVSPFIGWKENNGEEIVSMIEEIVTIRDNYGFETEVLVAAVRNGRHIVESPPVDK